MRKIIILLILINLVVSCSNDDSRNEISTINCEEFEDLTFSGDILITSQEELVAFGMNNYTIIDGDITISGINDLSPISHLRQANGFIIKNTNLKNLHGLTCLKYIDGENGLQIFTNPQLVNIEGLSNIERIERLNIIDNNSLTNTNGISDIRIRHITIADNSSLISISEFPDPLDDMGEEFGIDLDCYGHNCRRFIIIQNNEKLTSLEGFLKATELHLGVLFIINNNSLTNLNGLSNIERLYSSPEYGLSVRINDNDQLINLDAFSNLSDFGYFDDLSFEYIFGHLEIKNNISLINFCGFKNAATYRNYDTASFDVSGNSYNPTFEQLKTEAKCSK